MTKISALSDIGTSVASNDAFVLVDVSDPTTPNKKIQQQNLFLIPDGSVATPGLRFLNDTDTGIYRSGSNTLGLVTGASTRLFINSSGNVGIGTTSPITKLDIIGANEEDLLFLSTGNTPGNTFAQIRGDNEAGIRIRGGGSFEGGTIELGGGLRNTDPGTIKFSTGTSGSGSTERARIDSSGRLLVGTSSSSGQNAALQVVGSECAQFHRGSADTAPAALTFSKSRNTSYGSFTSVQAEDRLGSIAFRGDDGTDYVTRAAEIVAFVDGTPGANDMPGRLVFSTTPDGASSPTERMRITSDAYVRLASGTGGIQFNGDTAAANALDDYEEGTWTPVDSSGAGLSFSSAGGFYTKIGRTLTCFFYVTFPSTANVSVAAIGGLPFTTGNNVAGGVFTGAVAYNTYGSLQLVGPSFVTYFNLSTPTGSDITNANMSLKVLRGSFLYFV
jgi:hypothetical protein